MADEVPIGDDDEAAKKAAADANQKAADDAARDEAVRKAKDDLAIKAADDAARKATEEAVRKAMDDLAIKAANEGNISPALERALFVKFWTWLAGVSIFAVAAVTGITSAVLYGERYWFQDDFNNVKKIALDGVIRSFQDADAYQVKAQLAASNAATQVTQIQEKLKTAGDVQAIVGKVDEAVKSLGDSPTLAHVIADKLRTVSFTTQRFGPNGRARPGQDEGEFIQANTPYNIGSTSEFPICEISQISVAAQAGTCEVIENPPRNWQVVVTGYFSCKVTCFKLSFSQ